MGRSAGFIAVHAALASGDVDLCLVPEVPIVLEGERGKRLVFLLFLLCFFFLGGGEDESRWDVYT